MQHHLARKPVDFIFIKHLNHKLILCSYFYFLNLVSPICRAREFSFQMVIEIYECCFKLKTNCNTTKRGPFKKNANPPEDTRKGKAVAMKEKTKPNEKKRHQRRSARSCCAEGRKQFTTHSLREGTGLALGACLGLSPHLNSDSAVVFFRLSHGSEPQPLLICCRLLGQRPLL